LAHNIPFDTETLQKVADWYGTPVYVYSENEIVHRCQQLRSVFKPELPVQWLYAMKANDNPHLLRIIADQGFGFDTVSSEEMHLGMKFHRDPSQIFYTENNMTDAEMQDAVKAGVVLNIGSLSRLKKYCDQNQGGRVSIRIKPDIGDGHHSKVVTGNQDSKFGIRIDALDEARSIAASANVKIAGLHVHIGSGIKHPANFFAAMQKLLELSRSFDDVEFINFGGGLPIPYSSAESEFNLDELRDLATPLLEREVAFREGNISFRFEPGRYVMAKSGVLLTRVNTVKDQGLRTYLGCDTGFNHLIRPVLYDSWHEVINISKPESIPDHVYTLAGNICESGDLLAENRNLPATQEGDLLALADSGAYGMVMASEYNRRRLPAEVLINHTGQMQSIRRREGIEEVIDRHLKTCNYQVF